MSISSSNSYTPIPQRKPWTTKEDELLTELRKNNNLDWIEVARRIDGRNPSQCAQRWKRIKGFKLRKQWTEEENQKLKDLVSKIWLSLETGKQIREHYLNQLHPDINNEPWTKEEDEIVVESYKKLGGKWSQISKNLNNRSENSIKNRFYSYLRNKYLNIKNPYYIVPEKKQKLNESNTSEEKQEKQMTNPIKQESSFQTNYQQVPLEQNMQLFMPFYQNQFIQYPMAYPCAMFVPIYLYQQQGSQLNQVMRY
ncbi:unnamed protein product (macronuclear) [Paramecium tetraurelia]|uniref:Myb-like DNA-binding domain containing protein n=1 Tax=Paramecium tetraurelia TaxID=5888 RepID=A0DIV1_PARTE|nr:uncharacterized protein GSPATT00017325001 [Paramecium tetraurelia]CAK82968.1 unnamed protein product [Paramecium tetraurelia]|eukprot:XP_001450365.1 hypothetical protein (macronuclear) [Paramecium tetraurelia strain d4-2]